MNNDVTIEISNIENYTIQLNEQGPQGIAGPAGPAGPVGPEGPQGETGDNGADGRGIVDIKKTSTAGLVDTYTITYTNGDSSTFTVTNGADGTPGSDAEINGYNAITLTASGGLSLTHSDNAFDISGSSLQGDITTINGLIPSEASTSNKLADKNFVNSSIATNTANFIGTFASVSDLEDYSGTITNNDYAFVVNGVIEDNGSDWATFAALDLYDKTLLTNFDYAWVENGSNFDLYRFDIVEQEWGLRISDTPKTGVTLNTAYNRYKAVVSGTVTWTWEYTLNNSSFTASQWAAINSGATTSNISQITTNQNSIGTLSSLTTTNKTNLVSAINELDSDKQNTLVSGTNIKTINNMTILGSGNITIFENPTVLNDTLIFTSSTNISVENEELIFDD